MNVVGELLANGGQLPWRPPEPAAAGLSPRQRGIRQGAMLMLSTFLLVPLLAIIGVSLLHLPAQIVAVAAVFCPIGGLLRILYALFLESNAKPGAEAAQQAYVPPPVIPNYLGAPPARSATLPPAQGTPVPAPRPRRLDTGELPAPPRASVTDHTTRLLDKQPDEPPKQ